MCRVREPFIPGHHRLAGEPNRKEQAEPTADVAAEPTEIPRLTMAVMRELLTRVSPGSMAFARW